MATAVVAVIGHQAIHFPAPAKQTKPVVNKNRIELDNAMKSLQGGERAHGRDFYNSLISLCISEKALAEGNRLRAHLASTGHQPDLFLQNQFLNLYVKCGEVEAARQLFDGMLQKNVITWNAMISGCCLNGYFADALWLFSAMVEMGLSPNQPSYLGALLACIGSGDIGSGEQIHAHIIKSRFLSHIEVENSLINMYAKLGRLDDAERVFEKMIDQDVVSWNSVISANTLNSAVDRAMALFIEMLNEGLTPNEFTFGSLLGLKDLINVEELHSQITKYTLCNNIYIGSALLYAYARCGAPQSALLVFNKMPERNTVTLNSVIAACIENNMVDEGLQLFLQMGLMGFIPDIYTISSLLRSITMELPIAAGMQFHGLAAKFGLCSDAMVGNTLITMYSKHGKVHESQLAFNNILDPDIISWNSIIQCHVQNARYEEAFALFQEMKCSGTEPDEFSFVPAVAACASLAWAETGRQVHGGLVKSGVLINAFVGSALIDMYADFAALTDARMIFNRIEHKDLISWNSMIVGLAQNGLLDQAFKLLSMMREEDLEPDKFTFTGILAGCADVSALQVGKQVHALLLKSEHTMDAAVANSLITMYTRCGSILEAEVVFFYLNSKNIVSWTTMIGGYAQAGYSKEALGLFERMESSGTRPNAKTLLSLLTACSYAGMIDEAEKYFSSMETKYGITPDFEHYACMVDIFGRIGKLEESEFLIINMPYKANALVWRMLLSACRIHGDRERGRRCMENILRLEPGDSAAYVLLSNLYASLGDWDGAVEVRNLMKENGVRKEPGKSWIEVQNTVHEFVVGDQSHPQTDQIYARLRQLMNEVKNTGYVPSIEIRPYPYRRFGGRPFATQGN